MARSLFFISLAALALAACATPPLNDAARRGPFYTPANHAGDPRLPATLRRVVLLPIAAGTIAPPESAAALDPVFVEELQKQNRFEIVTLSRQECSYRFHAEEFLSTAALPHDFIAALRRDYAADAVLFIDLTVFKPYRPLVLGVRAKLAALGDDLRLMWTFDNVFSASDAAVANSARRHFLDSERGTVPADLTPAALESPARFASYVAAEMFATLPPVYAPPPPVAAKHPRKPSEQP